MTKFSLIILTFLSATVMVLAQGKIAEEYVCLPCGRECDQKVYDKPGHCSHCMMERVKKSTITFKNIEPDKLCSYLEKHPDIVLLDVRSKREFEQKASPNYGTLKNAINIPINELNSRLPELSSYKDRTIIVYCSHSQRSSQGSYLLTQNGFNQVINMAGGLSVMKDKVCLK